MTFFDSKTAFIVTGFFYELFFQYPSFVVHPVSLMVRVILFFEKLLLVKNYKNRINILTGAFLALFLILSVYLIFYFLEGIINHRWLMFFYRLFFTVSCVAAGSLFFECMKVAKYLEIKNLSMAQKQLSMLVTRDTKGMDEKKVAETTLETLSENLCDGVIAPLFYLFLGGIPLGMAFKMASTLDSMVGYRNEKYEYFGKVSARIDDVLNFIPARLTAFFIILAAFMLNMNGKAGFKCWLRDRNKSESPNSGSPEAAMAGVLGICFGGEVSYFGKSYKKPFIGDKKRDVEPGDIKTAIKLSYLAALFFIITAFLLEYGIRRFY